jgi:hypothetical protein
VTYIVYRKDPPNYEIGKNAYSTSEVIQFKLRIRESSTLSKAEKKDFERLWGVVKKKASMSRAIPGAFMDLNQVFKSLGAIHKMSMAGTVRTIKSPCVYFQY